MLSFHFMFDDRFSRGLPLPNEECFLPSLSTLCNYKDSQKYQPSGLLLDMIQNMTSVCTFENFLPQTKFVK
jgi:hypothetical protein